MIVFPQLILTGSRTPLHAAATFGQIEVMKLLITQGGDPNIFHDHGFHAIFQLFITANSPERMGRFALVDWLIRKQENFEFDVDAVDLLRRDLTQVIVQSETGTSVSGDLQQSKLVEALLTRNLCLNNQDVEGSTALHEATKCGRLHIVEQLLNRSAKPTVKDNRGRTPIHYAANLGNVAIVRCLLGKSNAGINDSDVAGWTPLRLAVIGHHLNMVKFLIDLGAHCDYTLLKDAVMYEAEDLFDYFLALGIKPNAEVLLITIHEPNLHYLRNCILAGASPDAIPGRFTPLTLAVILNYTSVVQLLLSMGANVNPRTDDGDSALFLAVRFGKLAIVDILLRAGAATHDLSFKEGPTVNLINLATQNGYTCIAKMLCKAGAPEPAADQKYANSSFDMVPAAQQNRVDILTELIHRKGGSGMIQDELYNAFKSACRYHRSEAAIFLINANHDLYAERDYPPLCRAARAGLTDVLQVLLDKGADINQLDWEGRTALLSMLEFFKTPVAHDEGIWIAEKLIRAGLDVNVVDKNGHTALGIACWHWSTRTVNLLLEAGADINIPSCEYERTRTFVHPNKMYSSRTGIRYLPLESAAKAGHEDIVQLLLAKGADWRSFKQQKAIATSHPVLVRHWFADDGNADDKETIFLGCEPPEAQLKASCPRGAFFDDIPNQSSSLSILI